MPFVAVLFLLAACDTNRGSDAGSSEVEAYDSQMDTTTMVNTDSVDMLEQNAAELNSEIDQFVEEL